MLKSMPDANVRFSIGTMEVNTGDSEAVAAAKMGRPAKSLVITGSYIEGIFSMIKDRAMPQVSGPNNSNKTEIMFSLMANRSTWVDVTTDPYTYHNELASLAPGNILLVTHRKQAVTGYFVKLATPEQYLVATFEDALGAGNSVTIYLKSLTTVVPGASAVNLAIA